MSRNYIRIQGEGQPSIWPMTRLQCIEMTIALTYDRRYTKKREELRKELLSKTQEELKEGYEKAAMNMATVEFIEETTLGDNATVSNTDLENISYAEHSASNGVALYVNDKCIGTIKVAQAIDKDGNLIELVPINNSLYCLTDLPERVHN